MKKLVWLIIGITVVGLVIFAIKSFYFDQVNKIVCRTQFGPCPDNYAQVLGATTDEEELKSILSQLSDVREITFEKKFPQTLEMIVYQRTPLGIVNGLVTDETGRLYTQVADSALPRLETEHQYQLGDDITQPELAALRNLSRISSILSQRFHSKLSDKSLFLTLDSGTEIVINVADESMAWSRPLQHILARSKIDGSAPRRIDLRFNNPVITF